MGAAGAGFSLPGPAGVEPYGVVIVSRIVAAQIAARAEVAPLVLGAIGGGPVAPGLIVGVAQFDDLIPAFPGRGVLRRGRRAEYRGAREHQRRRQPNCLPDFPRHLHSPTVAETPRATRSTIGPAL